MKPALSNPMTEIHPDHYDLMALNAENPKAFEFFLPQLNPRIATQILRVLEPFVWP